LESWDLELVNLEKNYDWIINNNKSLEEKQAEIICIYEVYEDICVPWEYSPNGNHSKG
jgi:hypothetical protein